MTTRSMTAAARRFHAWNTEGLPKKPLYDDEEEWEAKMAELLAAEADRVIKQLKEKKRRPGMLSHEEDDEEEDPMVCGNVVDGVAIIGCGGVCYRSQQPETWSYGYWSYCKDCQEEEE